MLCTSTLQKQSQAQEWENQNQFLQDRHGHKSDASLPETILVGVRPDHDGFQLLSWAINVASRPGDSVIAFQFRRNGGEKMENIIGKLLTETEERQVTNEQMRALKDICNVKQVHLDVKFSISGNEELELVDEASSVLATMIVVSPTNRQGLRSSQKRATLLAQRAPGCSVVVVKDYKVLSYKENAVKERKGGATSSEGTHHLAPCWRRKGMGRPFGALQRQFSGKLNPSWRDMEDSCNLDTKVATGSKVWPVQTGEISPRGVLDEGPGLFSESESSSPSTSYSGLSHSLSRRALLSRLSSSQEEGDVFLEKSLKCLNLWRNGSIRRSSTFPPMGQPKRFSDPLHSSSMRSSFRSYVHNLWGTDSVNPESCCTLSFLSDVQQSWGCFSYEELAFATEDFNPANMVGKGGQAEVYKGSLYDGRVVAIKRLTRGDSDEQKEREFLTELGIVGHVSHPNTTPLIGFCVEKGLYLIFHFSSHGSLATLLHGVEGPVLEWEVRCKVAVGTARGLHYLHTACQRRIIHRDIKASNILLGPDFEPQISDFGLAKWLPEQWTQLSVFPVEGTFGYLAPEYFMHGIINEQTDVFAFGVLLLELITGRQPIDDSQQSLVMWAKPLLESSRIEELADPRLSGAYNPQEMQGMVMAASLCVQHSPICRPDMGQVLQLLTEEGLDSQTFSMPLSQSDYFQDAACNEEYSSSNYLSDLSRHREVALQF